MTRTILVTGAAGFIGSATARVLLERGDRVLGLDDLNDFYDPAFKRDNLAWLEPAGDFRLVEGDIRDAELVSRIVGEEGVTDVLHLAARAGVRPSLDDPVLYADVNVRGTEIVLAACRRHDVERVVLASSSSVYGNNEKLPFSEDDPVDRPVSPYAATKRANELQAAAFHHATGTPTTCLRFFTVYGPRQRPEMAIRLFAGLIWREEPLTLFGDGSMRRDYTYIDDIVAGILAALDRDRGYGIFNLGGSQTTDLLTLVEQLESLLGKEAQRRFAEASVGDVRATYADVARAREELGYEPQTPIAEGLARFRDWFLAEAPEGPRA